MFIFMCVLLYQLCPTLCNLMDCSPPGSSVHGILLQARPHALLQGIFLTQGSNLSLLHAQVDSLPLSHLGSPHHPYRGTETPVAFVL